MGSTSVARIEPERSIASTIVACSAGTAIVASGRASATASADSASPYSATGACRRQPGVRGSAEARTAGLAKASAAARRRRCATP